MHLVLTCDTWFTLITAWVVIIAVTFCFEVILYHIVLYFWNLLKAKDSIVDKHISYFKK